ncbi:hypothetical protein ACJJTC_016483 [Scirpophaga incertulas]
MEKLKFTFEIKPSIDGKSNYLAITAIGTKDEKVFLMPEEYQAVSLHKHIQTSKTFLTDQFLEEITQEQMATGSKRCSEDPIVKILEKFVESQQDKEKPSIKMLSDKFVINKFDGKSSSAYQWMEVFEKECARSEESAEIMITFNFLFLRNIRKASDTITIVRAGRKILLIPESKPGGNHYHYSLLLI